MSAPLTGLKVDISGLNARPELNGTQGVAGAFDDAKGRYLVQLPSGEQLSLKPANLTAAAAGDGADVESIMKTKVEEAEKSKLTEAKAAIAAQKKKHSFAWWLHKRGGAAKYWKKRWCVIEAPGVIFYYTNADDRKQGKEALGALVLKNSSARRPSSLAGKPSKLRDKCFRVDLDPNMQPSVVQAAKLAADMDDDEGDEAVDVSEAAGPGRAKKTKWLLAAENAQSMQKWIDAINFWSKHAASNARNAGP